MDESRHKPAGRQNGSYGLEVRDHPRLRGHTGGTPPQLLRARLRLALHSRGGEQPKNLTRKTTNQADCNQTKSAVVFHDHALSLSTSVHIRRRPLEQQRPLRGPRPPPASHHAGTGAAHRPAADPIRTRRRGAPRAARSRTRCRQDKRSAITRPAARRHRDCEQRDATRWRHPRSPCRTRPRTIRLRDRRPRRRLRRPRSRLSRATRGNRCRPLGRPAADLAD